MAHLHSSNYFKLLENWQIFGQYGPTLLANMTKNSISTKASGSERALLHIYAAHTPHTIQVYLEAILPFPSHETSYGKSMTNSSLCKTQ